MTNRHDLEAVDRLEQTNHYANGVTVWEPYPVTPHRAAEAAHDLAKALGGDTQRRGPLDAGAIIALAMLLVVFILALVCMTAIVVVGAS